MSTLLDQLFVLLEEAEVHATLSMYCRSGLIGDLCRCWRCRGERGPSEDEVAAERDAALADRAWTAGRLIERELVKGDELLQAWTVDLEGSG